MTSMNGLLNFMTPQILFSNTLLDESSPVYPSSHIVILFEDGATSMACNKSSPQVRVFSPSPVELSVFPFS